jgi:glycerol-3-phosphate O-acyltransferase
LALPHIVAGNNLDLPVIGNMLKRSGAFFIKRSFEKDKLYSAIFKEYINVTNLHDSYNPD